MDRKGSFFRIGLAVPRNSRGAARHRWGARISVFYLLLALLSGLGLVLPAISPASVSAIDSQVGSPYGWGWNEYGQLGTGDYNNRTTPTPVSSITGVTAVSTNGINKKWIARDSNSEPTD
ncbi:MAG TPA: RCC1 domain-containing protein [Chloroflexia bacterium]|nr:RCC1 domain-containing protein [Chloroflexia bacterium]